MRIRDLESVKLVEPQPGEFSMAVARHITNTWPHPDVEVLHRKRAVLIENLVDESDVEVLDWGQTRADHPSEIVELVIGLGAPAIAAAATIISTWITRPKKEAGQNEGVLGLKMKRPDGTELTVTYRSEKSQKEIAQLLESFLEDSG